MSAPPRDVEGYIARAPSEARDALRQLRETVRSAAPAAHERISYGMPSYELNGRLLYFSLHSHHIGLYPADQAAAEAAGLAPYFAEKSTLQFPLDRPLPLDSIRTFVEQRVAARLTRALR